MVEVLKEKFDAIVVGTGPGGAAVARDLTVKGKEALMLEWGGIGSPQVRQNSGIRNAGVKDIFKTWWIASHPGVTCKINGIVNSDLKTEYDNLYVCDCSVIAGAPEGTPVQWELYG